MFANSFPNIFSSENVKLPAVLGRANEQDRWQLSGSFAASGLKYRRELDNGRGSEDEIETGKNGTRAQVDTRITDLALYQRLQVFIRIYRKIVCMVRDMKGPCEPYISTKVDESRKQE